MSLPAMKGQAGRDDDFQNEVRRRFINPALDDLEDRNYLRWRESKTLEEENRGDTLLTLVPSCGEREIGFEFKCVRWKGKTYTAIPLEFLSNSVPGRLRNGWMRAACYDLLLHVMETKHPDKVYCFLMDFHKLRAWWRTIPGIVNIPSNAKRFNGWHVHEERVGSNHTKSLVVPYEAIRNGGVVVRYFELDSNEPRFYPPFDWLRWPL